MSIIYAHFIRSRLATSLGGLLREASSSDFLKSFITLSLDGVFRGCFALGSHLSRFVVFFSSNPKRLKTFHFCPKEAVYCPMSVRWCDWKGEPQTMATPTPSPVLDLAHANLVLYDSTGEFEISGSFVSEFWEEHAGS